MVPLILVWQLGMDSGIIKIEDTKCEKWAYSGRLGCLCLEFKVVAWYLDICLRAYLINLQLDKEKRSPETLDVSLLTSLCLKWTFPLSHTSDLSRAFNISCIFP